MKMKKLWSKDTEIQFFNEARKFASLEQLFYKTGDGRFVAYWPKDYRGSKTVLQARNALIGKFTEKWSRDFIEDGLNESGLYAIQGAICKEISLTNRSPADVVISRKNNLNLKPEEIVIIFEVKMSIVWNWELQNDRLFCLGNYRTHQGNPGLLRSDSMLKAIGKSINIRVSSNKASSIPIIILGNTPITDNYYEKVDQLKVAGIIQGFWSLNSNPIDDSRYNIKQTSKKGFFRFDNYEDFKASLLNLITKEMHFFSSMKSKTEVGKLIEIANRESTYEGKAERFLKLLRENKA